jgi:Fic family protein
MELGLAELQSLPISRRLIEKIHGVILSNVRGQERDPGHVRTSPNWIGSPDNTPGNAIFVPPPTEEMENGLSDWERFVHEDLPMPPLVKCALLHYQFETLHPFLDGNGRLGRLLIVFFLVSEGHLPEPLLYVSSYFDRFKSDYYDRLQAVREVGDIQGWLRFFLGAVSTQATDAIARAEKLVDLREQHRERLRGLRSRAHELADCLLENPYMTTTRAVELLSVTNQGATNLLRQLEKVGILKPLPRVPGRANRWVAEEILTVLTEEVQRPTRG